MENELKLKIEVLENKIDAIYKSVEKTRKYFKLVLYLSLILFILPLIVMAIIIPKVMNTYVGLTSGF